MRAEGRRNEEHDIQAACVTWFRLRYPEFSLLLNAVPNGGRRDAVTGARLKAEGVVAGVADLELNVARHGFHGLKIEMKREKGRQSAAQREWQAAVDEQGYRYTVCRSMDEFMSEVAAYLC